MGLAQSLEELKIGDLIDSYDVVIRVNCDPKIFLGKEELFGSKTDGLYSSFFDDLTFLFTPEFFNNDIQFISTCLPNRSPYNENLARFEALFLQRQPQFKFYKCDDQNYENFKREMNTRPNTGVATIFDLLRFDFKELFITGFTFFKDGYIENIRPWKTEEEAFKKIHREGVHEIEPQRKFLKDQYLSNDKIKVDPILKEILLGDPILNKQAFSLRRFIRKAFINKD